MHRSRSGTASRALIAAVLALGVSAAPALAHGDGPDCSGDITRLTGSYTGTCDFPFQGYPIGMTASYTSFDPTFPSNVHVEVTLHPAFGADQSLAMECYDPALPDDGSAQPTQPGTSRCVQEYNDPVTNSQFTLVQSAPDQIIAMRCSAHSHAPFSRTWPVDVSAGVFACWSSADGRKDLYNDGVIGADGYPATGPPPATASADPCDAKAQTPVAAVPVERYAPQDLYVSKSQGLCYANLDLEWHDVVARDATRPSDSAPWCSHFPPDPDDPTKQTCPLFWTPLIAPGGNDAQGVAGRKHDVAVQGLEDAKVGQTYTYFCSIHPLMTGTITIVQ